MLTRSSFQLRDQIIDEAGVVQLFDAEDDGSSVLISVREPYGWHGRTSSEKWIKSLLENHEPSCDELSCLLCMESGKESLAFQFIQKRPIHEISSLLALQFGDARTQVFNICLDGVLYGVGFGRDGGQ